MARKSTVKRQPQSVREAIGLMHREHKSLNEILDALEAEYGVTLSRSALHRHVQGLDKTMARVERNRAIAEAMVARFGTEPESKTARANIEITHALIGEVAALLDNSAEDDAEDGSEKAAPKAMDAMLLAKAIEHLTKASRHDAELVAKIRQDERKKVEDEVRGRIRSLGSAGDLKKLSDEELEKKIAELAAGA